MIVVCSACQARFKVADEKVGPRGAKVRCSKCQTVFVVHRESWDAPDDAQAAPPQAAAAPAPPRPAAGGLDLDLESGPRSAFRPSGLAADPFGGGAGSHAPAAPAPDPYGDHDPFSAAPGGSGGGFGSVDPFVAQVSSPEPGLPTSAVTDLSDLLGSGGGMAPSGPQPVPELPAVTPPPEPSGILDSGFDFDPSAAGSPALDDGLEAQPRFHPHEPEPDLALAERTPAKALPAAPMPGFGDFAGDGVDEAFAPHPELGTPPHTAQVDATPGPRPAPAPPEAPPEEDHDAVVGMHRRASRIRAVVVNAISLVALLAVALGFLAYWRGVRPGMGMLLRPSGVLGGIGAPPEPFAATQLRSGLYERSDAPPILFVSGTAVSRADSAVPGLRVRVEVVRRGAVVARGEAGAGVVPTAEELYASRDAAGLAAAVEARAQARPRGVKPGESILFLVAISDYPADVAGAGLRVTLEPIAAPTDGGAKQP
jgi:predicted Zn finger-like uncharacterized protein